MVQCEQFVAGYFQGRDQGGLRVLKSPRLSQVLCEESMISLLRLGPAQAVETVAVTFLWKDRMFALSYLKPQVDEMGRPCVWNHSIILPIESVLRDWASWVTEFGSKSRSQTVFINFLKREENVQIPLQSCEVNV